MFISINCGHCTKGNYDGGATGNNLKEQDITRIVGNLVIAKLKAQGHIVTNCTIDSASSVNEALKAICAKSNAVKTDLFVSIHLNAFNSSASGTEVFTYGAKEIKQARSILNNIVALGFANRGLKDGRNLAVIKNTKASAMLIELCFIDSKNDMAKFNAESMADSIVEGLTGQKVLVAPVVKPVKPIVAPTGQLYKIQAGAYKSKVEADKAVADLKAKGIDSFSKLV